MRSLFTIAALTLLSSTAQSEAENNCNAYTGWQDIAEMSQSRIIMFGELHGTEESPKAVSGLVCELVRAGAPVRLGIEATHTQGDALDAALTWPISESDLRSAAPDMWSVPDGRGSAAILQLLENVALWRSKGSDIKVFAFDSTFKGDDRGLSRSAVMAREVDAAAEGFDGAIVLLTGGYHIALNPPDRQNEGGSLASEVRARPVLTLDMVHRGGTAYVTVSFNGGEPVTGAANFKSHSRIGEANSFQRSDSDPRKGYYFVGPITASPPAFPDLIAD